MNRQFIKVSLLALPLLEIATSGCCSLPQSVKDGSKEAKLAHEKFGKENDKFLETVKSSFAEFFDQEIGELQEAKTKALTQAEVDKISDFMIERRKKNNLKETDPAPLKETDLTELVTLIEERQKQQAAIFEKGIVQLEARKEAVADAVELLRSYYEQILSSVIALDTYIQLEKADELFWKELKQTLQDAGVDVTSIEEKVKVLQSK